MWSEKHVTAPKHTDMMISLHQIRKPVARIIQEKVDGRFLMDRQFYFDQQNC